jgi:hypothetical protein
VRYKNTSDTNNPKQAKAGHTQNPRLFPRVSNTDRKVENLGLRVLYFLFRPPHQSERREAKSESKKVRDLLRVVEVIPPSNNQKKRQSTQNTIRLEMSTKHENFSLCVRNGKWASIGSE